MNKRVVKDKICMEAKYLGPDIAENIKRCVCKKMLGNCDQEHGYILEAGQDIKILGNSISSAGIGVFFNIRFTVKSLKPSVGDEFEGKVFMVFEHGIILEVENLMKVFIAKGKMPGYRYSKSKQIYKGKTKNITVGDTVCVEIDAVEYEKKNFNCIGSLKDS